MIGRTNIKNSGSTPGDLSILYCYTSSGGVNGVVYTSTQNPVAYTNKAIYSSQRFSTSSQSINVRLVDIINVTSNGIIISNGTSNVFTRDSSGDIIL